MKVGVQRYMMASPVIYKGEISMRKFLILLICLLLALSTPIIAQEERGFRIKDKSGNEVGLYENSYALLIGVSDYTNGWPKLYGVKKDIPLVKSALEKQGFTVVVVEDPTYKQLQEAFVSFIYKYGQKPNDRLLIYFSGHGHTMKLSYGGEMGYIVPVDAPNPNLDSIGFLSKAMDMQQIEVYAKRIQSKHAMFMFDSCFSGSIFAITRAVPESISYKTSRPVRQMITAGDADETVPDESIFCKQFVEALDGEGDTDSDGYVTGVELGEFLQKNVINYSRNGQHPQYGKIRDSLLDKGDFVFQISKPVPTSPSGSSFSLNDLKSEADRLESIERVKQSWASNLSEMKSAFDEVKSYESRDVTPSLKATAWSRFIDSFKEDNPYSQDDDYMSQSAKERLDYWQNTKGETKPKIDTSSNTIIGKDGAEMVLITAGEFQMGSNDGQDNEKPVHSVYLDAFYMDKYEVTNAQYRKFMDATGYKAPSYWNDPKYNDPKQPVVGVSWNDAKAYADWASKRLPTEAEWEKAARGGLAGKKYPLSDNISHDDANYSGTGGKDQWKYTSPVGSFSPNGYGLYDMAGNVWEWCSDWYDSGYYSNSPESNPTGPSSGTSMVIRGGSWYYFDDILRVAYRYDLGSFPASGVGLGFRCVQ